MRSPDGLSAGALLIRRPRAASARVLTGMPVSTPWKSRSGGPKWIPFGVIVISRMVRSCAPLRFLSTEIATGSSPSASK